MERQCLKGTKQSSLRKVNGPLPHTIRAFFVRLGVVTSHSLGLGLIGQRLIFLLCIKDIKFWPSSGELVKPLGQC